MFSIVILSYNSTILRFLSILQRYRTNHIKGTIDQKSLMLMHFMELSFDELRSYLLYYTILNILYLPYWRRRIAQSSAPHC